MDSRPAPTYVRLKINDRVRQNMETISQTYGIEENTEILKLALNMTATGSKVPKKP